MAAPSNRPIRIGNISGATGDSPTALSRMVSLSHPYSVDIIVGDWLSEMNIAWNAIAKQNDPSVGYEQGFLDQLKGEGVLEGIREKGIKVVTNAGALNTLGLVEKVKELCDSRKIELKVAAVIGDDITELFSGPEIPELPHLDYPSLTLDQWGLRPHCGVAYIGAGGIGEALSRGADIVICGRVTDASPVIGAASWWHGWGEEDYDALAGALVAGHLIECGPYVTGANFSGFKPLLPNLIHLSFPIAEISSTGSTTITRDPRFGGKVTKANTIAQLLYEIQGELYLNPDVVADLSGIQIEDAGEDRVEVKGVKGLFPPPTTKAMIAALGGYQAEATFYINGLDVHPKAQMMRQQLEHAFADSGFSKFKVDLYGTQAERPESQAEGTVMLRVFAQARRREEIEGMRFKVPIYALRMQSYPGYHMNLDFRTMDPKQFMEIFPVLIPLADIRHQVVLPDSSIVDIPPPSKTATYDIQRPSYETQNPIDLVDFGPTTQAPLGSIVHARSGDKANNSNIGFFVRHPDEYPWLQSFLTIPRLQWLFGKDWKDGLKVERCEFPGILAVHFRVMDFLDGGIASSSRIDGLGKGVGEYLRSRVVDVPTKFLEKGVI